MMLGVRINPARVTWEDVTRLLVYSYMCSHEGNLPPVFLLNQYASDGRLVVRQASERGRWIQLLVEADNSGQPHYADVRYTRSMEDPLIRLDTLRKLIKGVPICASN